jgi:peptidoglycan/xylan/chitin deacetylase (PgdA/CDA1 family)
MSSKDKKKVLFYICVLTIILLIIFLLKMLERSSANILYVDKIKKESNITINYPYFNNESMDNNIADYLDSIDRSTCSDVSYTVNYINNYISILFTKYLDKKVNGYDSFIYNQDGTLEDISSVVSDETVLKDRIETYISKYNMIINNYDNAKYDYLLKDSELVVIITSEDNALKSFNTINISYDALNDILKIPYEMDKTTAKINEVVLQTTEPTTTKKIADKVIAFTFDDGPSKYTLDILDILDEYNAKATFFEVGYMIKNNKNTVLEVINRGFEVGNHTTDHSNLNKLSSTKVKEKIDDNNALFYEITNQDMMLLRPPYGNCKSSVKALINVPIIKWSVDSRDWESRDTDKIVALVKSETEDGDIVLFHDLYSTTLEAIKILVPYFYEEGYEIVSVSELFEIKGITLENGKVYYSAKS